MTPFNTNKNLHNEVALLSTKKNFHKEMTPLNNYKVLQNEVALLST